MKIKISFFAIMLFVSLIISGGLYSLIPLFAAVLHELGHIFAARIRGTKLSCLNIGILGARLSMPNGICSYTDEIIICAAGPVVNLSSAYIMYLINTRFDTHNEIIGIFIIASLCLGILNLLPIKTFDGGRILSAFISKLSNIEKAEMTVNFLSFIFLFILWSMSVYLLLRTSSSLSLFIFSISLFASFFEDSFEKQAFRRLEKK